MWRNLILPPPYLPIAAVLAVFVVVVGFFDFRYRRIPNWCTVAAALAGLVLNGFLQASGSSLFSFSGLVFSLAGLALGFFVYLFLYAIRAISAGDVKMMGAIGALVGCAQWVRIWMFGAICGAVLGLIVVLLKKRVKKTMWNLGFIFSELGHGRAAYLRREELDVKSDKGLRLPHGVGIAVGALLYLLLTFRLGQ
jgi:prepilin peptidase CpaA